MKVRTKTQKRFEKFFHDLNTSKMITQPVFYGDFENTKEMIRHMDNYELLSIFDDYSLTDSEMEENVRKANYFRYERRIDLSDKLPYSMIVYSHNRNEKTEEWKDDNFFFGTRGVTDIPAAELMAIDFVPYELQYRDEIKMRKN